jgi:hypothetical protein
MPTPTTFNLPSINVDELNKSSLPSNVLNTLEGSPLRPPTYPDINRNLDTRIVPGGASSSQVIRSNFDSLSDSLEALSIQSSLISNLYASNKVALEGLHALQSILSSLETNLSTLTGSAVMLDFYQNSNAILSTSTVNIDPFYGQVTLKYLSTPQSHILRPGKNQARPGTIIQYKDILSNQSTLTAVDFNASDPSAFYALDGKLDTAWNVPVDPNKDLLVNIKLTPTLGLNSKVNAIAIIPWPAFGVSIIDVYIRTNESSSNSGWRQVSLKGQLSYNSTTKVIETAGAHRLFFGGVPVTEVLIRLRSKSTNNIGLIGFDCWTVNFDTSSKLDINTASLGVNNIGSVILGGTDADNLSKIIPTILGTQLTLNLTSGSIYDSPIITSIGLKSNTDSTGLTGFDFSVFAS